MKKLITLVIALFTLFISLKAQLSTNFTGYSVAHNNGSNNVLFELDGQTNEWKEIGLTGTDDIKAIATDHINKVIYAVDGGTFGKINAENGIFSPIGAIGRGMGDFGSTLLNNIVGLTYDTNNKIIYATHRIESGTNCNLVANSNDLLFQIDLFTGKLIDNVMFDVTGSLADYAVILEIAATSDYYCLAYDVNDIAYNVYTDQLYAIQNNDSDYGITIINPEDGSVETYVQDLLSMDLAGLSFNPLGELYGTTSTFNSSGNAGSSLYLIDLRSQFPNVQQLSHIDANNTNTNFESLDFFGVYNDLALKLSLPSTPPGNNNETTFIVTIYNQGELENTDISISNYIPEGLILNDPAWTLVPGTNIANYNFSGLLAPGDEISIPIKFTIDRNFAGKKITNSAEISASFNSNIVDAYNDPLPLPDIDSEPDDFNNELINGAPIVDNEINQAGGDEDDHDIAVLTNFELIENIPLQNTITPASCDGFGTAEIIITGNASPPFSHTWSNQFGDIVNSNTINSATYQIKDLSPGSYYVIVNDANNITTSFIVDIPRLAANNGNVNCDDNCPEHLTTTNNLLSGIFQAGGAIEINGFINGSQDTEFRICY